MKEAQVYLLAVYVIGGHPTTLRHLRLWQIPHHSGYQHLFLESNVLSGLFFALDSPSLLLQIGRAHV